MYGLTNAKTNIPQEMLCQMKVLKSFRNPALLEVLSGHR
jgi:hypothetical protein